MSKVTKVLSMAIATATMGLGLQSAHADDAKTYIPAFCRAASVTPATPDQPEDVIRFGATHGEIYNRSTLQDLNVHCPIVRDETVKSIDFIDVTYRDRNAASGMEVKCRVRDRSETGSPGQSLQYPSAGATPVGGYATLTLFLDSSSEPSYYPGLRASAMLECIIPRATSTSLGNQSAIFAYEVQEND